MIRLDDVRKYFRGVTALDGVHLQLHEGELLGLIGPNGSGKSTLLGVATGVLRPSGGRVFVGSADVTSHGPDRIARLGVGRTFQQIRLFEHLSVEETVAVGAIARGRDRRAAIAMIDRFGLDPYRDRIAAALPYGVQRRIEIARAMAGEPRFLLLDEPAAGMNEAESDELARTIESLCSDAGCGVLIVDHDMRLIMGLCQRIHVLNEGRTIAEGTPPEIEANPVVIAAYIGTNGDSGGENS